MNFIDLFRQGQEQPHHPVNKTGHHDGCRNRKNPSSHDIRGRSPPNRSNPLRDSNPDNRAGNRVSRTHGNPQAPEVSAQNPCTGFNRANPSPKVLITFLPPIIVPKAITE